MSWLQEVSNWLLGSYKVATTKLNDTSLIQHVTLVDQTDTPVTGGGGSPVNYALENTGNLALLGSCVTPGSPGVLGIGQGTATNLHCAAENYQSNTPVGPANPLQVSLANTGANSNKLLVTADAITGSVTANAGTNLNTSALALEAGHLANIDTHITACNTGAVVISSGNVTADTELPAAAALADNAGNPTTPLIGSCEMLWNPVAPFWWRRRSNYNQQLMASSSRSTAQQTAAINGVNIKGAIAYVNVTVASGTGGLTLTLQGYESYAAAYYNLHANPTAITATGMYIYYFTNPIVAIGGAITNAFNITPGNYFRWNVAVGDASAYTYSLSVDYLCN